MNCNINEKKTGTNTDRSIKSPAVKVKKKINAYLKEDAYKMVVKSNRTLLVMLLFKSEVYYQLKYCFCFWSHQRTDERKEERNF